MPINYEMQHQDGILHERAYGEDSGIEEVINYQKAIHKIASDLSIRKVFCDEIDLKYNIGLKDTYKLAEMISKAEVGELIIAIVTRDINYIEATFFELLINSNTVRIKFFPTATTGKMWLNAQP